MSDNNTVARPYAKAVFEFALQSKQISEWSDILGFLGQVVSDPLALQFIRNPSTTPEQQSELLLSIVTQLHPVKDQTHVVNLLHLLAQNKRLLVLPSICSQYDTLRAEHEKTLTVDVIAFAPLTRDQEERLIKRLSERLQRSVTLNVSIDKSLHGGAIIRAGHLVFDASVATQIKKLSANLAA
ncbi:MAG: F0F1 ATP synthase subunit delta [Legionellaceae bacterium]|nr:F0F1 ATP synthase subunit delta [Legionellaceae bacterium]